MIFSFSYLLGVYCALVATATFRPCFVFSVQSLAEKGGNVLENITAHENFLVLATMNPGGDYGKKELSPALRNRFTEIWVPSVNDFIELKSIALNRYASFQEKMLSTKVIEML